MQQTPVIRKALPEDAGQISELIRKVAGRFTSNNSEELAGWFLASIAPDTIKANINNPNYNHLVAFIDAKLVGVISVRNATHINHLFVMPEFHRKGVATTLWARAKTDALAAGNRDGFSVRSSEFAVPVYERFGFHVVGDRAEKEGIVFVPMRLELTSDNSYNAS